MADPNNGFLKPQKISLNDAPQFSHKDFSGKILLPADTGSGFNALLITCHGHHPRKRMIGATRVYFVVEGSGVFTLGQKEHQITQGDTYIIPPGQEYEYSGNLTLFEFNISPTNNFSDELVG